MSYEFSKKVTGLQASAIREILKFTSDPEVISFAAGNPAPEAFPVDEIKRISGEIFDEDPILALQYSVTEGYTPLRNTLKDMMRKNGVFSDTDELIITSGAQQANELAAKVLCNEGDTIVCEAPSFVGSLNAFKSYNVDLVGVPLEDDGINIEALEKVLKEKRVKLIYLIPNFQNPTGLTTSLEKRKAALALAKQYGAVILEDNPYGDLRFDGEDLPNIKSLDLGGGSVIYSRTFSKILAPGIRVGYVSAPAEIVSKMIVCKQVSDVHTNIWAQVLAERFLAECDLSAHLDRLRGIYRKKCGLMLRKIKENFSSKIKYTTPQGGLFIWCTLPEGSDMMGFCKRAVEDYKVAVVPGTAFLISETEPTASFRLNFSTPTDEQIIKGCELLGKLSKEMFGD